MAFTAGVISQISVGPTQVILSSAPATGGIGPYTYQWYRDIIQNLTPGPSNILTGATSLTLLDGGVQLNTIYFYILVATDTGNGNITANSLPYGVVIPTAGEGLQSNYLNPSISYFKNYFYRAFPFSTDYKQGFLDFDVAIAMQAANNNFRPDIWDDQGQYNEAYLNLTAHFLVLKQQADSQGMVNEYEWTTASKGGNGISKSSAVPTPIMEGALQAALTTTTYGKRYWEMARPRVVGTFYMVRNKVHAV
jgi:hypothetical protein